MTFLEKLDALKRETGDNNASLARNANIPYTTIDGLYKKGYSNMKLSTIQTLSNYFGVPLDYLAKDSLGPEYLKKVKKPAKAGEPDTESEEFVRLFTSLDAENRKRILDLMRALASSQA